MDGCPGERKYKGKALKDFKKSTTQMCKVSEGRDRARVQKLIQNKMKSISGLITFTQGTLRQGFFSLQAIEKRERVEKQRQKNDNRASASRTQGAGLGKEKNLEQKRMRTKKRG